MSSAGPPIESPTAASELAALFVGSGSNPPGSWPLRLSAESRRMLDRIGGGDCLSEAVVLQGAVALLLHRYGAPVIDILSAPLLAGAGISHADAPIQLRYAIDETMTGRDWLLQSRQVAAAAYSGRPAGAADGIAVVRDLRVHADMPAGAQGGLCFRFGVGDPAAYCLDDPAGLLPPRFAPLLAGHLDSILQGLSELDRPIAEIPLCRRDEVRSLDRLGDGGAPMAGAGTLIGLFRRWAEAAPDAAAVIEPGRVTRYGELEDGALRLAQQLDVRLGAARGARVAIAATRSAETVTAFLGAMLAGAAILPFDPGAPPAQLAGEWDGLGATLLVLPAEHVELALDFPEMTALCPAIEAGNWESGADWPCRAPEPDEAAAVIFTSGSQGRPKGVLLDHAGLANTVTDHVMRLGVRPDDRCVQFMAPFFDGGILDIFTALASGSALLCPPAAALADPEAFHDFLIRSRATLLTATPPYLAVLDPGRLPDLRVVVSAAEQARAIDFRRLAGHVALFNGYGPTEASVNTTLYAAPPNFDGQMVPIGRPSAGKRLKIVDGCGRLLPAGVIGEIVIRGAGLAQGYANDPALTADRFPTAPDGEREYRTGDLAAWNADGDLHFSGRRDQQVKIGGRRVELGHIERALFALPGVRDAAVISAEGRLLGFYVAEVPPGPADEDSARARLGETLPGYMVPAELYPLPILPRRSNGKIDAVALAGTAREWRARRPAFRVRSATEAALLEIWRDALQMEEIDEDGDFFRLGGDSIRVIQAVHNARARGYEIDAADLIDHRTLRSLARALEARATGRGPAPAETDLSLSQAERASLSPGWSRAFPVSGMQGLMLRWYEDPVAAANDVYHCLAHWQLRDDPVQPAALTMAARALARRHPILRTGFAQAGPTGRIVQAALPEEAFAVRVSDLTALAPDARDAAIARITNAERRERFRQGEGTGAFARLHLILRSATAFDLILAAHHAVIDGWSGVTLENDFVDFYRAAKCGTLEIERIEPGPGFAEFVAADLEAARSSAAAAFWRERWRRMPEVGQGGIGPAEGIPLFGTCEAELPGDIVLALAQAGRQLGVSPKAACLTAFSFALRRGEARAPGIGVVANGRSARLTDPIGATGLFWNITPFLAPPGELDALAVQAELDAMAPFETHPLVTMCQAAGRDALFDACFNFIQMHHARSGFGGLEETGFEAIDRFHFGLTLFVDHDQAVVPPRCGLRLEYRPDRCGDQPAGQILADFAGGLAQLLDPGPAP